MMQRGGQARIRFDFGMKDAVLQTSWVSEAIWKGRMALLSFGVAL
jgi:hypothetical protein